MYESDDVLILLDRFNEGDTIPDVSNMSAIAYAFVLFGDSKGYIKNTIKVIHNNLHAYDKDGKDLLVHQLPDYDNWE